MIKPPSRDGGEGVVVGITDTDRLVAAFEAAQRISPGPVIVERHVPGEDHRLLVVDGRVLQVVRRRAAHVVGDDGMLTVRQLLNRLNSDPWERRSTACSRLCIWTTRCAIFWPSRDWSRMRSRPMGRQSAGANPGTSARAALRRT